MLDINELTEWSEYVKLFAALFAMVSPPIILPLFLGVVGRRPKSEQLQIALTGTIGYFLIMIIFTFLGESILSLFGITIHAFRVAGGLLLLLMALEMMRHDPSMAKSEAPVDNSSSAVALGIVPLALPILAGPGTISTLVVLANHENEGFSHQVLVAIVVAVIAVYLLFALRIAVYSGKLLSDTVTVVFYRVMGLLIASIGVEFIMDGIAGHFPALGSIDH